MFGRELPKAERERKEAHLDRGLLGVSLWADDVDAAREGPGNNLNSVLAPELLGVQRRHLHSVIGELTGRREQGNRPWSEETRKDEKTTKPTNKRIKEGYFAKRRSSAVSISMVLTSMGYPAYL